MAWLVFVYALTRIYATSAGRVYAAYSAIYLAAALVWMKAVEGATPDRWDLMGEGICLFGAFVIILPTR
jgi:small multidrug resistance family-3 protein